MPSKRRLVTSEICFGAEKAGLLDFSYDKCALADRGNKFGKFLPFLKICRFLKILPIFENLAIFENLRPAFSVPKQISDVTSRLLLGILFKQ